jgi:hypothetical protein
MPTTPTLLRIATLLVLLASPLHALARPHTVPVAQVSADNEPIFLPVINTAPTPPPTPVLARYDYAAAMREGFKHEADQPNMPHYDLTMQVDPVNKRISGRVELWFRNTTGAPLGDVVLRLYPNFPADYSGDGGNTLMTLRDVVVQDTPAVPRSEAQNTAARIALPKPAAPGEIVTVKLNFQTSFNTNYPQDRSWQLASYYPMLAAWQNGWRTDVSTFPDRVYAHSALYHARITLPSAWTAVMTGSALSTTTNNDGTRTFEAVSGPVREFAFSVGQFASVQAEHEGTLLVVWYEKNSGLGSVASSSLTHLKRALTTFNGKYGPYPYRELDTHLVFNTSSYNHGIEFPGLIYIVSNGTYSTGTRIVLSHELAHQWFYGVLGNDIFNEAWLDEAFGQYSPYLTEQQWYGQAAADTYLQNRIINLSNQSTKPAGLSVWEYGTWTTYKNAVYGKGAHFLHSLRLKIGDAAFSNGLQGFYVKHKYGVVHKADFLAAMEASSGQELDAFFLQWLGR